MMDKYYKIDTLIELLQKQKEQKEYYVGRWWLDYVLDHLHTVNRKEAQKMCLEMHEDDINRRAGSKLERALQ